MTDCYASHDWRNPWEVEPQILPLPRWADSDAAWEV